MRLLEQRKTGVNKGLIMPVKEKKLTNKELGLLTYIEQTDICPALSDEGPNIPLAEHLVDLGYLRKYVDYELTAKGMKATEKSYRDCTTDGE